MRLVPIPVKRLHELVDDRDALAKLAGATPSPEWPSADLREALSFLASQEAIVYAIVSGPEIVGDIGFHGPPDEQGALEVGFFVVPSARRLGIASDALETLARDAIARGISLVRARCNADNTASIRVLEKAEFRRVAEVESVIEWELYSGRQYSPRST